MNFRKLNQQEILEALHLIWRVYAEETLPNRTEQQVELFRASIRYEHVMQSVARQELIFLGGYEQEKLTGAAALTPMGKITFFAVEPSEHKNADTAELLENLKRFSTFKLRTASLKVDAEQDKVIYFQQFGFMQTGREFNVNGMMIVPMECAAAAGGSSYYGGSMQTNTPGKNNGLIIGIIVAAVLGLTLVCSLIGYGVYKYGTSQTYRQYYGDYDRDYNNGESPWESDLYDNYDDSYELEPEYQGIESIDMYEDENITYTIEESSYNERKSDGKYQVDFLIKYPQLSGLSAESADMVNQVIKDTAMNTVNEIYLSPDESMKESLLKENMAYLVSYVNYKVTYAGNDFLSLVLEDNYYKGDISKEYTDLRSVNINLKTGEVYEVKDIVNLSENYMSDWMRRMKEEAPASEALGLISKEAYKKALEGDSQDGKYQDVFFVDADGMEIGISYHYENGDDIEIGWVTAPYMMDEVSPYKTQSEFWNIITI